MTGLLVASNLLTAVAFLALGALIERRANRSRYVPLEMVPDRDPRR